jgi:hypothetical protein
MKVGMRNDSRILVWNSNCKLQNVVGGGGGEGIAWRKGIPSMCFAAENKCEMEKRRWKRMLMDAVNYRI